jgi:hypothetical protein
LCYLPLDELLRLDDELRVEAPDELRVVLLPGVALRVVVLFDELRVLSVLVLLRAGVADEFLLPGVASRVVVPDELLVVVDDELRVLLF